MTVVADLDAVTSADASTVSWLLRADAQVRLAGGRFVTLIGNGRAGDVLRLTGVGAGSTSSAAPARTLSGPSTTPVVRRPTGCGRLALPFPSAMPTRNERSDVAVLLRTEHAVARVLASAPDEDDAHPRLLAAIGEALGVGLRRPLDAGRRRRHVPALRAHVGGRLHRASPPSPQRADR